MGQTFFDLELGRGDVVSKEHPQKPTKLLGVIVSGFPGSTWEEQLLLLFSDIYIKFSNG